MPSFDITLPLFLNQWNSCNKFEITLKIFCGLKLYLFCLVLKWKGIEFFSMQYFCDFSFFYHQQYTCNWHAKSYFSGNDNFPIDYYVIHIHSNWFFFNFIVVGSLWEQLHVVTDVSPASDRRSRSYPADWPWQGWNFENSECRVTGQVRICESDSCGPEFCDSVWLCKWDEGHSIPHCAGESRVMT